MIKIENKILEYNSHAELQYSGGRAVIAYITSLLPSLPINPMSNIQIRVLKYYTEQ